MVNLGMGDGSDLVVSDVEQAKAALSDIDWSFHPGPVLAGDELKPFDARKYHWYPATFVPQIPFTLIDVLTSPGATVYDPFSGIGTTYFQALSLSRFPVATEICYTAVDYTRGLSTLFSPNYDKLKLFDKIDRKLDDFERRQDYHQEIPDRVLLEDLRPWYSSNDLNELCYAFSLADSSEDQFENAILRIAISDTLKTHCSQDRGWGCIADNMEPNEDQIKYKGALNGIRSKARVLLTDLQDHLQGMGEYYEEIYSNVESSDTVFHQGVEECSSIDPNSVDLVVTSPPYPEMTDYVAAQRLSYYWHGERVGLSDEFNDDMNSEIGARRKRSRKRSNQTYLEKMHDANQSIVDKVSPRGYICYVLPEIDDDDDERKEIVEQVLLDLEHRNEIERVDDYFRAIPSNRRAHNIKWTSLNQERISLFRKV